ncbi:MAG TPA: glutamate-5-semialdehyde dehydrogenase [Saprospiraceae bacterium]|nr:glutamate-5-semialdehyde dehydrogenase [Saprospiraceae bacterium]HMQ84970.1 glutamate-5-semialdehyde dehydrogenase [Saprospiraceae bacterium]
MATKEMHAIQSKDLLLSEVSSNLEKSRAVTRQLVLLDDQTIASILNHLADLSLEHSEWLIAENRKDLDRMNVSDPKYDRLQLTPKRLQDIARDLRKVASLSSPLNRLLEDRKLENGLLLRKVSVPLGVVAVIFESRPNVMFDVFALCLKSGNASVLKGSRDAHYSNLAILSLIREALAPYQLENACYLAPSDREALQPILNAVGIIDVAIPRGSQGLIDFVRENAKIPVIETGAGIVHTFYDASGDLETAKAIVENAKSRRVSVCNALDTLLVHQNKLEELPDLLQRLGQVHRCEVFADEPAFSVLAAAYPGDLLHPAEADSFGTEFLSMKMSVKTVANLQEALDHIDQYSSKHSEAIIATDKVIVDQFMRQVDAAVVYANTTTAFTDGQEFGMGAEIGISTQKLHARGPMALQELTSYKWLVTGEGQIRN